MLEQDRRPNKVAAEQEPELITRFSIALMAFTLMGMGVGSALPRSFGVLTLATGIVGLVSYAVFESTARRRHREAVASLRTKHEDRLSRQVSGRVD